MREPKMDLMKDGYHYNGCSAVLVENGKITKYFYATHSQGIIGFTMINPIPAWNTNDTWSNLATSRVKQVSKQYVDEELTHMPSKCRLRLQKCKHYAQENNNDD